MINADMRFYNYWTIGNKDSYGQAQMPSKEAAPIGAVKMAIYSTNLTTQDNIKYKDCNYIGLTNANVNDKFIIQYGDTRLKVLTVTPQGRYKQVFLKEI